MGQASGSTIRRGCVALAVAYALVAQLLLAGAAAALAAGPARDGDFRTLFCRPSASAGHPDAPSGGTVPGCCLMGCGVLTALAAAPPAGAFLAPLRPFVRLPRLASGKDAPPAGWRRTAHLARAPPAFGAA